MRGIYIKGIKMPKRMPIKVLLFPDGRVFATLHNRSQIKGEAIPVPDHGDLADRDRIKYGHWGENLLALKDMVDKMPTIIPADKEECNNADSAN